MEVLKDYKVREVHKWSDSEKTYLEQICSGKTYKEISILMTDKFAYNFSVQQIKSAMARYNLKTGTTGQFKKGVVSRNKGSKGYMKPNKTSFQKGNIPHNHKPIGSERIGSKDGYTMIKTGEPSKWELKHKFLYERHYGKIEKDSVVIFLDGNKSNFNVSNLKCVTRGQLAILNNNKLIKEDARLTEMGIEVANLILKASEAKRKIKSSL